VNFDLNNFGKPVAGDRIQWLSAEGGIVGGLSRISFSNIWDLQNAVNLVNQRCGNTYSLIFYPVNGARPAENCAGNSVTANAVSDDFISDVEAANAISDVAGDFAVSDEVIINDLIAGDLAVVDDFGNVGDVDPNLGGDFAVFDDLANVGDVDPNLGGDFAVVDDLANVGDVDPNLGGDFAVVDDFANIGDVDVNLAGDWDPNLDFAFIDDFGNMVGEDGFGDFLVMDAAVDGGNSASGSNGNSAVPAYAVALIVLGVLLLAGLIVIQVQIVLLRRARANNRLRQEEVI